MNKQKKLGLVLMFLILTISPILANCFSFTYLGPYYGIEGTGSIYFSIPFDSTGGGFIYNTVFFNDFNMTNGIFGTIGFYAPVGVSITVEEVIPDTSMTITTTCAEEKVIVIYLPTDVPQDVTGDVSFVYNGYLAEITIPNGITTIIIDFTTGPTTVFFFSDIIDSAFNFFGITGFFTTMYTMLTTFGANFVNVTTTILAGIAMMFLFIVNFGAFFIDWTSKLIAMAVQITNIVVKILNGSQEGIGAIQNIWNLFNVYAWIGIIPLFIIIAWLDSLDERNKKTGAGTIQLAIGDIQILTYIYGIIMDTMWTVLNFIINMIMQFISAIGSKIP